jgi:hypothetical protein
MTPYRRFLFILTITSLVVASCTKPVLIGSDLLEDEKSSLKFEDNFDLSFYTEETDSVIVHSDNVSLQLLTYLCGHVDDPIFGSYSAEIYAQPVLFVSSGLDLLNSSLDSVVLQLRYDTLGNYGSLNDPVTLEVYRMTENPNFNTEYYSNERFSSGAETMDILGSLTFIPEPYDSITVGASRIAPSIRIPLLVEKLVDLVSQDSSVFTHIDSFLNYFNGLHIRMTGANNTMLGFNLLNSDSKLSFYYDKGSEMDKVFSFIFTTGSIKTVYMEHDYAGSFVEPYLSSNPDADYWFVQGMAGVTTRMSINNLSILGDAIINQAELEVYCTFLDQDNPPLYPPIKYMVTQELTDTSLVNSIDVNVGLARSQSMLESETYKTYYGGVLEKVSDGPPVVYRYNMKVTGQVKDIFRGEKENIIYFNPFEKPNVPNRSVMFGPDHPVYAPRLRVYYTAL